MDIVIPKTESEINEVWIRQNIGLNPLQGTINIDGNVQAGLGFLSNLCRVSFKTEDGCEKNILVKLLPENPEMRAVSQDQKFDQTEIKFYTEVKPELLLVCPELEGNLCKDYGGKFSDGEDGSDYGSMLIMDDLKPAGYQVLNAESIDWKMNLEKILVFLARLHAAGYAVEEKRKMKITQLYPYCMGANDSHLNLFVKIALDGTNKLKTLLEKYNCPSDIRSLYGSISGKTTEIMYRVFKKGEDFPCLIHGDLWPANIMVASKDLPVKIIDWQWFGYRDPTYELAIAILTCMPKSEMQRDVVENLARFYYKELSKALESKDLLNCLKRSEEEFINFFHSWGMGYAYVWLLLSIDVFHKDEKKLHDAFVFLQENYEIVDILAVNE